MKSIRYFLALVAAVLALVVVPAAFAQQVDDRLADDQYNFATQLFGKKLYELAIQQYEKFAADYPKHANVPRARIRIGESYLRLNKYQQAADAYQKVLADAPQSNFRLEVLVGLGLADFNLGVEAEKGAAAEKAGPSPKFDQAVAVFSEAVKLAIEANDKNLGPIAANWLGESLYKSKRFAEAVPAYQTVLKWPGNSLAAQALYSAGYCQMQAGRADEAIISWLRVVDQYPTDPVAAEANYRAADLLLQKQQYPLAEQKFRYLLEHYQSTEYAPQAQMGLARLAFEKKDYAGARTAFEAVEKQFGKSPFAKQAKLRAADCCYYMKDYDTAASRYEAVAKGGDPALAREARYWLGVCRVQQNDTKGAVEAFGQVAADTGDPKLAQKARARMADLQLAAGDLDGAATTYRAAMAAAGPEDSAALDQATYGLGLTLYRQKKLPDAEAQFAAVVQRHAKTPAFAQAAIGLAQCQIDQNRPADAIPVLTAVLKSDLPAASRTSALYLLGAAQIDAKQGAAAIASLREVLDKSPDSEQAPLAAAALAGLYRDTKQDKEAADVTRLLVEKYGSSPAATDALVSLAEAQRQAGQIDAAVDLYQKTLTGKPAPAAAAAAHAGLALCFSSEKKLDFDRAERELQAIGDGSDGLQARTRYFAGLAFEKAGHLAEAGDEYQAVLKANPGDEVGALAAFRSGVVLSGQKKFNEARAAFAGVVDSYPKSKVAPEALYQGAWACIDGGKKADAAPLFQRLEKEYGDHPLAVDATFRLAEEDFAAKHFAEAAERYQRVASSPQAANLQDKALYKLGWCQRELKDQVAATRTFMTLVDQHGQSPLAVEGSLRVAEGLAAQGKKDEAAGMLRKLVSIQKPGKPEDQFLDAEARVDLAAIYLAKGQIDEANQTAERAATTAFQSVGMRAEMICGDCLAAKKQWKEAAARYLRVVTIYPKVDEQWAMAYFRIGECAEKLHDPKKAQEYWQQAVSDCPGTEGAQRSQERLGK